METIHKIYKVTGNQIIIDMPLDFINKEVEITLKILEHKKGDILELERKIDKGIASPVSPRTHKEIFQNLRNKYEAC